jgi:hypothetical protein
VIPISLDCPCGQRYEFEIEPADGQMPGTVACPTCGADGTAAANDFIGQTLAAQPAAAPPTSARLRVNTPPQAEERTASGAPASRRVPGRTNREQSEKQARLKIEWGETPAAVNAYLVVQGWTREEASDFVDELFRERVSTLRVTGIRKIVVGAVLTCVPVLVFFLFMAARRIHIYLLIVSVAAGGSGLWMLVSGIVLLVAPKSHSGNAEE